MERNVFLDDLHFLPGKKQAPEGWLGLGSYEELVAFVTAPDFDGIGEMSFDFELKPGDNNAKTGFDAMVYLADMAKAKRDPKYWPKKLRIHTDEDEWRLAMTRFAQEIRAELREMFPATATASS